MLKYDLLIGGQFRKPDNKNYFDSVSPVTGEPWAAIPDATASDVDSAVVCARDAFPGWASRPASERGRILWDLADLIAQHADHLAEMETRDNGKLLKETRAQLAIIPDWYRYYAGLADKIEGRVIPFSNPDMFGYTQRVPRGVVGIVIPWNSPTLLASLAMAPAVAAGNTVVLKPAELASVSLLEFARLLQKSQIPSGVINILTGGAQCGRAIAEHTDIEHVVFTGGSTVGAHVASSVGNRLRSTTLELGGKNPNIVFSDANLDAAIAGTLAGIFGASGQTCVAGARSLIQSEIYDEFVERLVAKVGDIRLGSPLNDETDVGPLISRDHAKNIIEMLTEQNIGEGRIITGGRIADAFGIPEGFSIEPTVIADANPTDPIARDELFGPVLSLIRFDTEDDAVRLANDTRYGLAAGIWTKDVMRCHRMSRVLEAGTVWVNMYRAMTYSAPFGGFKDSGFGRLNGQEAIDQFLHTKTTWINLSDEVQDPFTLRS